MAVRVCVRACECVCARVHGRLNSVRACVHVCVCAYAAHRRMYGTMQLNRAFHMADRWRIYSTRPMQRPAPIYDIEHTGRRLEPAEGPCGSLGLP